MIRTCLVLALLIGLKNTLGDDNNDVDDALKLYYDEDKPAEASILIAREEGAFNIEPEDVNDTDGRNVQPGYAVDASEEAALETTSESNPADEFQARRLLGDDGTKLPPREGKAWKELEGLERNVVRKLSRGSLRPVLPSTTRRIGKPAIKKHGKHPLGKNQHTKTVGIEGAVNPRNGETDGRDEHLVQKDQRRLARNRQMEEPEAGDERLIDDDADAFKPKRAAERENGKRLMKKKEAGHVQHSQHFLKNKGDDHGVEHQKDGEGGAVAHGLFDEDHDARVVKAKKAAQDNEMLDEDEDEDKDKEEKEEEEEEEGGARGEGARGGGRLDDEYDKREDLGSKARYVGKKAPMKIDDGVQIEEESDLVQPKPSQRRGKGQPEGGRLEMGRNEKLSDDSEREVQEKGNDEEEEEEDMRDEGARPNGGIEKELPPEDDDKELEGLPVKVDSHGQRYKQPRNHLFYYEKDDDETTEGKGSDESGEGNNTQPKRTDDKLDFKGVGLESMESPEKVAKHQKHHAHHSSNHRQSDEVGEDGVKEDGVKEDGVKEEDVKEEDVEEIQLPGASSKEEDEKFLKKTSSDKGQCDEGICPAHLPSKKREMRAMPSGMMNKFWHPADLFAETRSKIDSTAARYRWVAYAAACVTIVYLVRTIFKRIAFASAAGDQPSIGFSGMFGVHRRD
eukprot:GHVU01157543.1.p1 GENE.GHVU01157543.1~~GHVU01157543.1.p1  ORF type:complete len:678 (+),score=170.61 GHVU01157543.1:134-2167(+)